MLCMYSSLKFSPPILPQDVWPILPQDAWPILPQDAWPILPQDAWLSLSLFWFCFLERFVWQHVCILFLQSETILKLLGNNHILNFRNPPQFPWPCQMISKSNMMVRDLSSSSVNPRHMLPLLVDHPEFFLLVTYLFIHFIYLRLQF